MGRKAWGWTHGIISYVALALIVVHLLWIGTTAAPVRALLGLTT
jgi:DMSO/TMAO reductase YedYZ heme-binding membrane subunit